MTKTNFLFEIDHPVTAIPEAIQATLVGKKGILTWKFLEINKLTETKTSFVFQINHPKKITAKEIVSKMTCKRNALTLKVLRWELA